MDAFSSVRQIGTSSEPRPIPVHAAVDESSRIKPWVGLPPSLVSNPESINQRRNAFLKRNTVLANFRPTRKYSTAFRVRLLAGNCPPSGFQSCCVVGFAHLISHIFGVDDLSVLVNHKDGPL